MTGTLPRLILVAAFAWAGFGPARAALPKHPPAPPARPVFESDVDAPPAADAAAPQDARNPDQPPAQTLDAPPAQTATDQAQAPVAMRSVSEEALLSATPLEESVAGFAIAEKAGLDKLTREYARRHGLPLSLLHRIIMRESRYCPRLVNRRYYGLMQMTAATARSMGYRGAPQGLLDPETNLRFGAPYLANAWKLADGDPDRAVRLYASGYYYTAKSRNMLGLMRDAKSPPVTTPQLNAMQAPPPPPPPKSFFDAVFGGSSQ